MHRVTWIVWAIDCVRLGLFDVSVRIVKLASIKKQLHQAVMNPEQLIVPAERGCDREGGLVTVDSFVLYCPWNDIRGQEDAEAHRPETLGHPLGGKRSLETRLPSGPFVDFQCLLGLLDPSLVEV